MELQIKEFTPPKFECNFDALEAEIKEVALQYEGLIYTDDQIKIAKTDVAELRKFSKAMNDERIAIKKKYLKPYEEFEAKVKELDGIIQKPIALIDGQVKEYEEKCKAEKLQAIHNYWNERCELDIELVFDKKWLNASTSMKSVEKDIDDLIKQIQIDLTTLSNLPEFGFEATEVYKSTLDITQAISEGQRLAEIQKRKQEAKDKVKDFDVPEELPFDDLEAQDNFIPNFDGNQPIWRTYKIELTTNQKLILDQFLQTTNIRYVEE